MSSPSPPSPQSSPTQGGNWIREVWAEEHRRSAHENCQVVADVVDKVADVDDKEAVWRECSCSVLLRMVLTKEVLFGDFNILILRLLFKELAQFSSGVFSNDYAFAALKSDRTVVAWGSASWTDRARRTAELARDE